MNGLFPIIRRKRRPLVVDVPPIPTKTETGQPVAAKPLVESVPSETGADKPETNDAEIPPTTDAS
jgi:hypothetical protein